MCSRECWIVTAIIAFITYPPAMYLLFTSEAFESWHCLGAPYLYVTFHDSVNGPVKYSRDGCSLTGNVLQGFEVSPGDEFRSMAVSTDNSLFVVESRGSGGFNTSGAKIMEYGQCDDSGVRRLEALVLDEARTNNVGASHPYGVALVDGPDGSVSEVYTSFQNTDVVLRFHKREVGGVYIPMPLPKALRKKKKPDDYYYPGTFYQIGKPGYHKHKAQGVRSITFVGTDLWVADEKSDRVIVVDSDGYTLHKIELRNPIGMHYSAEHSILFVGSRSSYGMVVGYNATTGDVVRRFHVDGMTHPTGLVSYQNTLYVLEQSLGLMYAFSIASGQFEKVVFSGLQNRRLEQIVLSHC